MSKRLPIGSRVKADSRIGKVIRHGRDASGVYTEVEFADGSKERFHRSNLTGVL